MRFHLFRGRNRLDRPIHSQSDLLKMRTQTLLSFAFLAVCVKAGAQTPPIAPPVSPPLTAPGAAAPGAPRPASPPEPAAPVKDPNAQPAPDANLAPNLTTPLNAEPELGSEGQVADPNGQPLGGDYTGPSILSRGFNFARPTVPTQSKFRPFAGVNALYDSGLTAPTLTNGRIVSQASYGADFLFGISGRRSLRKQLFTLDYRGHLYYYQGNSKYNGQDHLLSAAYTRYVSSRLLLSLHEAAGLFSNTYSSLSAVSVPDISTANVSLVINPNTETFNTRTLYSTTELDAVYQKTARLSFDVGTSVFAIDRNTAGFANAKGVQARADTAYRVTRRTTVGVYYAYTYYDFSHVYGNSDIHSVGLDYSVAFTKTMSLKLRGGGSRVEVQGLQTVTLDPVVAAILGQSTGITRYYQVSYVPDVSASVTQTFRHGAVGASFAEGVSPGNGLYLTSRHQSEGVNATYTGIRSYAINLSGGHDQLLSIGDFAGAYSSYYISLSSSHPLFRHLQATAAADYRHLGVNVSGYGRNEFRLSLGFSFAPGEGPLKFW